MPTITKSWRGLGKTLHMMVHYYDGPIPPEGTSKTACYKAAVTVHWTRDKSLVSCRVCKKSV